MILAADIGNTTVALAALEGRKVVFTRRLPGAPALDGGAWGAVFEKQLAGAGLPAPEGAVLSSVVPALTGPVGEGLERLTGRPTLVVEKDTPTGLSLERYDVSNLGMDRVVDCVAALTLYGGPAAVFDLGTATTLSVADKDSRFLGGMILAGVSLGLEALAARAAQLPPVTLAPPEGVLGTDTISCMRHGALYGAVGAIESVSRRLEEELGPITVVLTGGHSSLVAPLLQIPVRWEPDLTFLGLGAILERNRI